MEIWLMVDDLDEMEIHADWVGGEVWGNLHWVMRAELAAVILSWGVRWRCDWVCLGYRFEMNHHPEPGWLISLLFSIA